LFSGGIINVHPSLLPRWRGPSPVESSILAGELETGVSVMKLTAVMDAGPIYLQQKIELTGDESKTELYNRLFTLGGQLLVKNLDKITNGELKPMDQDESEATYSHLLSKDEGVMDGSKPAEVYEREVRAYAGWPRSTTMVRGGRTNSEERIVVTKVRVARSKEDGALVIDCKNSYLEVLQLIAPSGKTMSGRDFLRGH
jgi:methionyl-tRNA formyltransferase